MEQDPGGNDTSASADLAVQAAAEPARASDAELLVLHVCDPNSSNDAAGSRRVICARHRPDARPSPCASEIHGSGPKSRFISGWFGAPFRRRHAYSSDRSPRLPTT
jgi:hypothetical protein